MIEIKNLHKSYINGKNRVDVLKGIDISIAKGEMVSIVGPSGSGKSTLLNVLGILDNYDEGEYHIDNVLIKNLNAKQGAYYRNQFLGFVFQSFNLLSFKNAMENVALPLYYRKVKRKERNEIALKYLEKVGLGDRWHHLPSELSGGQNQRVAIARAMANTPKVILADEPTGALDSKTSADIVQLFKELNKEGITIILVTHDMNVAKQADRIIRIKDGVIAHD